MRQIQESPDPWTKTNRSRALRGRTTGAAVPSQTALRGRQGKDPQGGLFQYHRADGNRYSVPVEYAGRNVTVKLSAWKFFQGREDRLLRTSLRQGGDHMHP
ncbi:Mu transposase domain-containing protein [Acetomicrobium sp.]|uniref:Mu transposase domain-containing protein n=1 Tax=Acetomicrobium sp. TaxID=1872099 RepID=UPI002B25C2CF|nr:hypothetical protein [Acetomicrobium sp.]